MAVTVSRGACSGIRVVEFASVLAGPYCGQLLADMGADVIKVESLTGDPLRATLPEWCGLGAMFLHNNRGKRSICLDLQRPAGALAAARLMQGADVVIENFRPGVMERLGLSYETVAAENPSLVYASITGFGPSGPYAGLPAYDHLIQGLVGAMWQQGEHGSPEPIRITVVDRVTAMTAFQGILAALLHRAHTGEGQKVSVSLLSAYAAFALPGLFNNDTFLDAELPAIPPRKIYHPLRTQDGYVIGHVQTDDQFRACVRLFGREDMLNEPRFNSMRQRLMHLPEFWQELAASAMTMNTADWVSAARAAGVPLAPVNTVDEFQRDSQAIHCSIFSEQRDAELGLLRQINPPIDFSRSAAAPTRRAPRLGEHSREILDELGYSRLEQETLVRERVTHPQSAQDQR